MKKSASPPNIHHIIVVPFARKNLVKEVEGVLKVYTTAPAVAGKANAALVVILAEYFKVKKNQIEIIKGLKSQIKNIRINI